MKIYRDQKPIRASLIYLILSIYVIVTFAQNNESIIPLNKGYLYKDKLYTDIALLESEIKKKPLAWDYYTRYNQSMSAKKISYMSSGIVTGISVIVFAVDNDLRGEEWFTKGQSLAILGIVIVTPTLLISGLISSINARKNKDRAIIYFNNREIPDYRTKKGPELSFNINQNGIGLVMNF